MKKQNIIQPLRNHLKPLALALTAGCLLGLSVSTNAAPATITYIGIDTTTKGDWRSTSVNKPLDISGDNAYGTDGFMGQNGATDVISNPTYATLAHHSGDAGGWTDPAYALLDPAVAPAPTIADQAGWEYWAWGSADLATITMTASKTFRVAVYGDNRQENPSKGHPSYQIHQTAGGAADSGLQFVTPFTGQGKWLVFEITASAGDVFKVYSTKGSDNYSGCGPIALDSISSVPGYTSWAAAQVPPVTGDPSADDNNDGVANGVAYFMNATGLATNPGIVGGSVTWPNGAKIPKTEYGAGKQFVVQISSDLQVWNDVPDTDTNLTLTDYAAGPPVVEASVKYTLPTGAPKSFVRLKAIPK